MASDLTRARKTVRQVAAELGVSVLDVWGATPAFKEAIKARDENARNPIKDAGYRRE